MSLPDLFAISTTMLTYAYYRILTLVIACLLHTGMVRVALAGLFSGSTGMLAKDVVVCLGK